MMPEKKLTIADVDQLHVDAVVEMIRSRRITDAQANAINTELLRRSGDQIKSAFRDLGSSLRTLGDAFKSGDGKATPKPEGESR